MVALHAAASNCESAAAKAESTNTAYLVAQGAPSHLEHVVINMCGTPEQSCPLP